MKVAFVDTGLTAGGTYTVAGQLSRCLLDRGHSALLVGAAPPESLTEMLPAALPRVRLQMPFTYLDRLGSRDRLRDGGDGALTRLRLRLWARYGEICNIGYVWRLRNLLRRNRPDVVSVSNSLEAVFAAWLAARPIVYQLHGPLAATLGALDRAAFSKVTAFSAVSRYVADTAVSAGIAAERVTVLHNFLHPRADQPTREDSRRMLGLPPDVPVVAMVGRIVPWKGQVELVRAVAEAARRHPRIHLLIAGDAADGTEQYLRDVHACVAQGGLAERTHFTGHLADSYLAYRAADVLAHCSIDPEPFGMVLLEAMDAGTPVVAANSGGPLEIIEDGVSGLLVDPKDPHRLADALSTLLTEPERAEAIRARARLRLREKFSPDVAAHKYLDFFERVVAACTSRP
jgi:glycosyltransferase involved in cell wall biosynthesis